MYVCIHTYTYTYIHTYIYIYIYNRGTEAPIASAKEETPSREACVVLVVVVAAAALAASVLLDVSEMERRLALGAATSVAKDS